MTAHVQHRLDMAGIHAVGCLLGEGPHQFAPWPHCQKQSSGLVLHGAVVRKRGWVKPNAVEANLRAFQFKHPLSNGACVQAAIEEGIPHVASLRGPSWRDWSCALTH